MELFKFASTLFLGIGIAAVLQGRLVPENEDYPITSSGRRFWVGLDVTLSSAMLVLIAAGEFLAVRSFVDDQAGDDYRTITIILLFVTAGYVIVHSVLKRALASAWTYPDGVDRATTEPALDRDAVKRFLRDLGSGLLIGAVALFGIAINSPDWIFVALLGVPFWAMSAHEGKPRG